MRVRFLREVHFKQKVFIAGVVYDVDKEVLEACKGDFEVIEDEAKSFQQPPKDKAIKSKEVKNKEL